MYNGGISSFQTDVVHKKSRMDMAQILQGLSHKICSIILPNFFAFGLSILVSEISAVIHQWLVAMIQGHMVFAQIYHFTCHVKVLGVLLLVDLLELHSSCPN